MKLARYKQNLKVDGNKVYSYSTHVANIYRRERVVEQLGYWSVTTQKHINYVAKILNFNIIKNEN